jgi:formylglycine-generating enzyme required for sulfatase activity
MVRIPAGSFMMGSPSSPEALPQHRVMVRALALAEHPVTVAEWRECIAARGCGFMPRMAHPSDETPIHNVSWDDAQAYVKWLSARTGRKYRLPSEAEWEYAARGNTTTSFWWGNDVGVGLANCSDCGGNQQGSLPLPVETFKPNEFGLYDMNGGVAEWVADCWKPNYQNAPNDSNAVAGDNCESRVLRGGSFRANHEGITAFARSHNDVAVRYITNGFRVAASQ